MFFFPVASEAGFVVDASAAACGADKNVCAPLTKPTREILSLQIVTYF